MALLKRILHLVLILKQMRFHMINPGSRITIQIGLQTSTFSDSTAQMKDSMSLKNCTRLTHISFYKTERTKTPQLMMKRRTVSTNVTTVDIAHESQPDQAERIYIKMFVTECQIRQLKEYLIGVVQPVKYCYRNLNTFSLQSYLNFTSRYILHKACY